ncbi:3-isopropylmalate dehydratase small subunit [Actinoplanes subtropicus]|uniref:3-isopropylmalate dehydratase small subunit n=1 Tax=Actinoplanes subtropicus TaxID=543632 RepID=UPI0004C35B79|nr:3-isopropylmalate dehydratase small subunit [Actinoplanes subtropicus]
MKPLRTHVGTAVPLRRSNVDTDQIYPAQLALTGSLTRTGHAPNLMGEWRKEPDFVLNRPEYEGASILVAGPEFGTGSSREWAVWALVDYGFRVILSPRFGDIFRGNAANNGLVAAALPEPAIEALWEQVEAAPQLPLAVDLEGRTVSVNDHRFAFEYPDDFRWRVMNGVDEIELTLRHSDDITAYEARRRPSLPKARGPEAVK